MAKKGLSLRDTVSSNVPSLNEPSAKMEISSNIENDASDFLELNKSVLVKYGEKYFYEAKIVKIARDENGEPLYTLHYKEWSKTYDEVLTLKEALDQCKRWTPEDAIIATEEIKKAQGIKASRKSSAASVPKQIHHKLTTTYEKPVEVQLSSQTADTMVQKPKKPSNDSSEEYLPFQQLVLCVNQLFFDETFIISHLTRNRTIKIPEKMIQLASKISVFPVKRSVHDVLQEYYEEISNRRRRPYRYGNAGHVITLFKAFEEQCKQSLQFYILPAELETFFKLLNEKRREQDLSNVSMYKYTRRVKPPPATVSEIPTKSMEAFLKLLDGNRRDHGLSNISKSPATVPKTSTKSMETFLKLLNKKRHDQGLTNVSSTKFTRITQNPATTPTKSLLKVTIMDVLLPMNDKYDQVALVRYIFSFMQMVEEEQNLYQFYYLLFNDLLLFMDGSTSYDLYEMM